VGRSKTLQEKHKFSALFEALNPYYGRKLPPPPKEEGRGGGFLAGRIEIRFVDGPKRGNMKARKAVLVVEKGVALTDAIYPLIKAQGYHALSTANVSAVPLLVDSKDRIHVVVLVDENTNDCSLLRGMNLLQQMGERVPIIVTGSKNDPDKEKNIRAAGVFYYHLQQDGIDELITAISCAMKHAVEKDAFIPFEGRIET
jgi:hypothetical protein